MSNAMSANGIFDDLGQDLGLVSNAPNNGQGSDAHLLLINGNSGLAMKPHG